MIDQQRANLNDDDEEDLEESNVNWANLIFLPFHPAFRFIILLCVICKTMWGPLEAAYLLSCLKKFRTEEGNLVFMTKAYICDPLYATDFILHIMHRQVTDEAVKREFVPKSIILLFLDLISLIPFYRLLKEVDECEVSLWPNGILFLEFLPVYRIVEYFSLMTTNYPWKMILGFVILSIVCINFMTCALILLTVNGLCKDCGNNLYDWRQHVMKKDNYKDAPYYSYAATFVLSFFLNCLKDLTQPSLVVEYFLQTCIGIFGYIVLTCIVLPKLFSDNAMRINKICKFIPRVRTILYEAQLKNPAMLKKKEIQHFYSVIWNKRNGITQIPGIILELPRYLNISIKMDLVWPIFYHSPVLRQTSPSFKRWLCSRVYFDYKLPNSIFFTSHNTGLHFYYIKSGIIQIMSLDEGTTPIISFTAGTVIGDSSFFVPPLSRHTQVVCLTYCEVYYIKREDILRGMNAFPADRKKMLQCAKDRLKHAKTLYLCKQHVRGLDRTEDEGIAWVKKRWWGILETIDRNNSETFRESFRHSLPEEDAVYHCAKYIGQVVLCRDIQRKTKSLFRNVNFPFTLAPHSIFEKIWSKIVLVTVFVVLFSYPPIITMTKPPKYFVILQIWVDFVYTADIFVSLITAIEKQEVNVQQLEELLLYRCKKIFFILDVLSALWLETFVVLIDRPDLYYLCLANRLLKIYVLFKNRFITKHDITRDPCYEILYNICLTAVCFYNISCFAVNAIVKLDPGFTRETFFIKNCDKNNTDCDNRARFEVFFRWLSEIIFGVYTPKTQQDVVLDAVFNYCFCLLSIYCQSRFVAVTYLRLKNSTDFQFFVSKIEQNMHLHTIPSDLMQRLKGFLNCQWKNNYGKKLISKKSLKNEPFDIYNKIHIEHAMKIISSSQAFMHADPSLIRELAHKSSFVLIPKNTPIMVFGVRSSYITWLSKGFIQSKLHDSNGELKTFLFSPGHLLSLMSVFFQKESIRSHISCTDCETLVIKYNDFTNILKRFPNEELSIQTAVYEFRAEFETHFNYQATMYEKGKQNLWSRFRRNSVVELDDEKQRKSWTDSLWINPQSKFIRIWMLLRCITVVVSITSAALQAGGGANHRLILYIICKICESIALVDILIKCFLAYYNENGILVVDPLKCMVHYWKRGFLLDVIGFLPWYEIIKNVPLNDVPEIFCLIANSCFKFAHIYLLIGYFDFLTNTLTSKALFLQILKWQIVYILLLIEATPYLMQRCLDLGWDRNMNLLRVEYLPQCWHFEHSGKSEHTPLDRLNMIFAESINLSEYGILTHKFRLVMDDWKFSCVLLLLRMKSCLIFWYCVSLLVLNSRGNQIFQHSLIEAKKFLTNERVKHKLIDRVIAHFGFWWVRTHGINMWTFMNKRVGLILNQDITVYFFNEALKALDSTLKGGDSFQKQLASCCARVFFLSHHDIMREMDLCPLVYIVHRGKVAISKNGVTIAELSTGAVFGQLDGVTLRPVQVSVTPLEQTDLLQIPIAQFQECLNDNIRKNIANDSESKYDYIRPKTEVVIDPYKSLNYELRGRIAMKFPWCTEIKARSTNWLYKWLFVVWIIGPTIAVGLSLIVGAIPTEERGKLYYTLIFLDILHWIQFASEFYVTEFQTVNGVLVKRPIMFGNLKRIGFYLNLMTLLIPVITIFTGYWIFQLARLIQVRLIVRFYFQFCKTFKRRYVFFCVEFIAILLLFHLFTCAWIYVACRVDTQELIVPDIPPELNETIYYEDWQAGDSLSKHCIIITRTFNVSGTTMFSFLKAKTWKSDYVVALTYVIILYTRADTDILVTFTIEQIYFKIFLTFALNITGIWISSIAISSIHAHYREMYHYKYQLANLLWFLKNSGLCHILLDNVRIYCEILWDTHRGNWFPKLLQQAPHCLREDIYLELYHHHLDCVPLFRHLPHYFIRQMVARFHRVVVFPGKYIVKEGDVLSYIYFIHEGDVEKWVTDKNGENKMVSLLGTNGYFGLISGLFPKTPHQFSYVSRTVVDLVYLRLSDWEDLLNGYPDVRHELYAAAKQLKREVGCL